VSAIERRAERLAALAAERELDLLTVTDLVNVRYLTGFTGTSGICALGPGVRVFGTDFRYYERVKPALTGYEVRRARRDVLEIPQQLVEEGAKEGAKLRVGFDDAHMTVRAHARLTELLGERAELVAAGGLVEQLRAVKDAGELRLMAEAAALADEIYAWLVSEHGLAGHTERAVALALEAKATALGADGLSFPPIVAAADNGALPHAEPRDAEITRGTLVVVDLGCRLAGYCSDCTRTFATGAVGDEEREVYALVQQAQAAALAAVRAGAGTRELDGVARRIIEEAGHAEEFGHGLGHGVGLEVHEAPRLGPGAAGELAAGNAVTIEPGVYLPGRFGVRIEDLVAVRADGADVLTTTPKDLVEV